MLLIGARCGVRVARYKTPRQSTTHHATRNANRETRNPQPVTRNSEKLFHPGWQLNLPHGN